MADLAMRRPARRPWPAGCIFAATPEFSSPHGAGHWRVRREADVPARRKALLVEWC